MKDIEEKWGDYLIEKHDYNLAVNHYIEAGQIDKSIQIYIKMNRIKDATKLISELNRDREVYYKMIGDYYSSKGDGESSIEYYIQSKNYKVRDNDNNRR